MSEGGGGVRYWSLNGDYQCGDKLEPRQLEEDTAETHSKREMQRDCVGI